MHEPRECKHHGLVLHHRIKSPRHKSGHRYVCKRCNGEAVSRRQRKVKATLVAEHGGCCQLCGYNKYQGALQFHHLDPDQKEFNLQSGTTRSLDRMRVEANKCVLLCANCHAEIEAAMKPYLIKCQGDKYAGKWVVLRSVDNRVMTESHSVKECCRWVKTWGPSSLLSS